MWTAIGPAAATAARHASRALPLARLVVRPKTVIVAARPALRVSHQHHRGLATAGAPKKKTTAAKKKPAKKPAAKKPKKKVAAKKKKPAARPRKVLTPEEKVKLQIREARKAALLKQPARLPDNVWTVYVSQSTKGSKVGNEGIGATSAALSRSFKDISSLERQQLQATAEQNRLANLAAYKAWVESHTPEEIAAANNARNRLAKLTNKSHSRIADERQPKRPVSAYLCFVKAKWASNDYTGTPAPEVAKAIASEWKGLSGSERQGYEQEAKADLARYENEVKTVLNREIARSPSP
ncbi:uncharacterized protein E0L32_000646 [Thyridium curvatum]|uniref:HMG box domain-containing protein n=1 Tax=Thyridium curvatum TaxID=1093900 RepID=A0A507AWA7_9PEZI|nr:uncharacterized protein E0L32_000646 [Thyridium curvatum]TPX14252.1 hypothetical protein E0L32_000646 [Thyridium curvatum]